MEVHSDIGVTSGPVSIL